MFVPLLVPVIRVMDMKICPVSLVAKPFPKRQQWEVEEAHSIC
jgi:hypothetical protein